MSATVASIALMAPTRSLALATKTSSLAVAAPSLAWMTVGCVTGSRIVLTAVTKAASAVLPAQSKPNAACLWTANPLFRMTFALTCVPPPWCRTRHALSAMARPRLSNMLRSLTGRREPGGAARQTTRSAQTLLLKWRSGMLVVPGPHAGRSSTPTIPLPSVRDRA
eukprot:Rmarinus@m.6842